MPPTLLQQLRQAILAKDSTLVKALITVLRTACDLTEDYQVIEALQRVWGGGADSISDIAIAFRDLGLASADPQLYLLSRGSAEFLTDFFRLCRYQKILAKAVLETIEIAEITNDIDDIISAQAVTMAKLVLAAGRSETLDLSGLVTMGLGSQLDCLAIALDQAEFLAKLILKGSEYPPSWRYCLTQSAKVSNQQIDQLVTGLLTQPPGSTRLELLFTYAPVSPELTSALVNHINGLMLGCHNGATTFMAFDVTKLLSYPEEFRFLVLSCCQLKQTVNLINPGQAKLTGYLNWESQPKEFLTDLFQHCFNHHGFNHHGFNHHGFNHHGATGSELAWALRDVKLDQTSFQYCFYLLADDSGLATDQQCLFLRDYLLGYGHSHVNDFTAGSGGPDDKPRIVLNADFIPAVTRLITESGVVGSFGLNHTQAVDFNQFIDLLKPSRWTQLDDLKQILTNPAIPPWLGCIQAIIARDGLAFGKILDQLKASLTIKMAMPTNPLAGFGLDGRDCRDVDQVLNPVIDPNLSLNQSLIEAILLDPVINSDLKYLVYSHCALVYLGAIYLPSNQPRHYLQPELQASLGWP